MCLVPLFNPLRYPVSSISDSAKYPAGRRCFYFLPIYKNILAFLRIVLHYEQQARQNLVPENWGDVSQRLFPEDCSLTLNCSRTASILLATRYPLDERHFLSVETVRMYCRYLLLVLVQRAFHAHRADSGTPGPVARHAQSSRPFLRPRGLVDAALAAQVGFVRFGGLYHLDAGVGFEWLVARVDCPVLSVGFRHRRMVPGDPL